jgi:hypothetical protein
MLMSDKSESDILIVDGDAAVVMRALSNHTALSYVALKELVKKNWESDDTFDLVLKYIQKHNWLEENGAEFSLTEEGVSWLEQQTVGLDVEKEDVELDDNSRHEKPPHPYDVVKLRMEPRPLSVFQVLRKIEKNQINLNPEFQRAFVWDVTRESRLIESILIRIPLPAFYIDATDQVSWNVVDGLQRLTTLKRYCLDKAFALSGLEFLTELEGKCFDDLPPQYRVLIEDDTQLQFYNLMPGTPIQAKYTIFARVNTGGMQLTPQEIRHALSQGKSTTLLGRLSKNPVFRNATDGAVESLRMSDRELILRSLGLMYLGVNSYRDYNQLDKFLLHAMSELNGLSDEELDKLEGDFVDSLLKVRAIFSRYAFRKIKSRNGRRNPFNKALFEVWTVSVQSYPLGVLEANKDKIIDRFIDLVMYDAMFSKSISSSTSSYWAVYTRFYAIENLLQKACQ